MTKETKATRKKRKVSAVRAVVLCFRLSVWCVRSSVVADGAMRLWRCFSVTSEQKNCVTIISRNPPRPVYTGLFALFDMACRRVHALLSSCFLVSVAQIEGAAP